MANMVKAISDYCDAAKQGTCGDCVTDEKMIVAPLKRMKRIQQRKNAEESL